MVRLVPAGRNVVVIRGETAVWGCQVADCDSECCVRADSPHPRVSELASSVVPGKLSVPGVNKPGGVYRFECCPVHGGNSDDDIPHDRFEHL